MMTDKIWLESVSISGNVSVTFIGHAAKYCNHVGSIQDGNITWPSSIKHMKRTCTVYSVSLEFSIQNFHSASVIVKHVTI